MEETNKELEKQSDEIISQNPDEIESLNDNEELDSESLEQIAGGSWGCKKTVIRDTDFSEEGLNE